MPSFFLHKLELITVLICDSYMSWRTRFISLKLYVAFSIFDSVPFLLKFIYLFNKVRDSLTLKHHNSFQNWNNRNVTYCFAPRRLIFKFQQKVLKFNDICGAGPPQNWPGDKFFKLRKSKFWERLNSNF